MTFRSRVDWWFYLLLAGGAVVVVVALAPLVATGELSLIWAVAVCVASLAVPVWLLISTNYQVSEGVLSVKSGPFRWRIHLDEIQSIEPSRSLISSPALSLDRLAIHYSNGKKLLVSPSDKEGFLQAIGRGTNS